MGYIRKFNFIRIMVKPVCLLCISAPFSIVADSYFDPSLLMQGADNIDLSQFAKENSLAPGVYNLSLFINEVMVGEHNITFVVNDQGNVVPSFTPAMLASFGVDVSKIPALKSMPDDAPIEDIKKYIPDATIELNVNVLVLKLSFPQVNMVPHFKGQIPVELLDKGVPAAFLNYIANMGRNKQTGYGDTNNSTNVYVNLAGGLNLDVWRLRSAFNYSRSQSKGSQGYNFTDSQAKFNNTYIMRAIGSLTSTLKIGEISTAGNVFDSIPLKGITLATNQLMRPSSMRGYAPIVSGIANSNATVTIRQNGNVIYQTFVPPGDFKIEDIPASGSAGDMEITIEEEDGSKRVTTQAYSSLPVMVRQGYFEYEVSAGKYDGGTTIESKESKFALASFIYGLPKGVTAYGGTLLANHYTSVALGTGFSLGTFGALSTDITISRAEMDKNYTGQSYRIRYSKSMLSSGTSFDLTALRYSTENYYSFSDYNNAGYDLRDGAAPWLGYRQRSSFQTSITQTLGEYGSMYFRGTKSDYWGQNSNNTTLSLGYNTNLKGINYNLDYSIDRLKTDDNNWPENHRLNFRVSIPFSLFSHNSAWSNMSSTYSMAHNNNDGRVSQQVGLTGNALSNKLSYGIYQQYENKGVGYGGSLNGAYTDNVGSVGLGYSYSKNTQSFNANVNGGIVAHPEGITLSPLLGANFAVVTAKGAKGALLTGGQKFDQFGNVVVTQLSAYDQNMIAADVNSLPEDVTFTNTSMYVYPTEGAVLAKTFNTKVGYQVIFTLKAAEQTVPFGAVATFHSTEGANELPNTGIVDSYQKLYMSGLPAQGQLTLKWGDAAQTCNFNYSGLDEMEITEDNPVRQIAVLCQ